MKVKHVPSDWIEREGRRLDCGPYLSGVLEVRMRLEGLPGRVSSCIPELMRVYGDWRNADRGLDPYRAATKVPSRTTTTDHANFRPGS